MRSLRTRPVARRLTVAAALLACTAAATTTSTATAQRLELAEGDHIVLIGNTLAERMQHHGWLETYVQAAAPGLDLVFRNHGYCGDTVDQRPRNNGFIPPHEYLKISEADVILACFGYNESFGGDPEGFRKKLEAWIDETRAQTYNGKSAPRIALLTPIAHENLESPNLPDGRANNARLIRYAAAVAEAARNKKCAFVDLFAFTSDLYQRESEPQTINGVHLTSAGNRAVARHLTEHLFGLPVVKDDERLKKINAAVVDKNWYWFNRYRATDGNDVWGGRSGLTFVDGQTNKDVLWHELFMIDVMVQNRDAKVWAVACGNDDYVVDDSNVPPPVRVKTNVGGGSPSSSSQKEGTKSYATPEETVKQLQLAEGLEAGVFASEEMFEGFANPVQMGVDTKGRLWAALWPTYPKWEPLKKMTDRLVILPDENRDGKADEMKTFAWVHNPTGFEFWNGGVLVVSAPDILFLKDTDGDDVADVRIRVMHGLDSADTHHTANNLVYGPDGNIYYQRGVFHVSNVESPWQGAQKHGNSAMYRFNPRTFEFAFHAGNSPNPHGIAFDHWGYHYASDGTGGQCYQVRPTPDGKGFKMQKVLEKTVRPVSSSTVLSSDHLPPEYQNDFVICNTIGFLGVKQYDMERKEDGNVWGTEQQELVKATTDRNFRPTDLEIGDDGAIYVSDWQNIIIGHMQHNVRDPSRDHEFGRIYRITATGRELARHVPIDDRPVAELVELLTHKVEKVRHRVHVELSERDTAEVLAEVAKFITRWDPKNPEHAHHLLEALWVHQQHNVQNRELLELVKNSPVHHARTAARTVELFWNRDPREVSEAVEAPAELGPMLTAEATLKQRGFDDAGLKLYKLGAEVYMRDGHCYTCHQRDGKGLAGQYPPITPNEWTLGDDERLVKIVLKGLWGELELDGQKYNTPDNSVPPMTAFGALLSDEEAAAVLTYVRNTFGNDAKPVTPETVARIRKAVAGRSMFYMTEDIQKENPFRPGEAAANKNGAAGGQR